jgi:hypothetical protein
MNGYDVTFEKKGENKDVEQVQYCAQERYLYYVASALDRIKC